MVNVSLNKARELADLDKMHYLHPLTPPKMQYEQGPPIIVEEGNGIRIKDVNGQEYIDGMSMLWNVNLGHGKEELGEAAKEQMTKLAFSSSFNGYSHEPAVRLANKIATLTPGDLNVVFYTSGGSEANDTAFKLARYYWKQKGQPNRQKIISFNRGYHGVAQGSTSATGIKEFNSLVSSKAPDFIHADPHLLDCELGDKSHKNYSNSVRGTIEREGAENIAAVIMEPIMGAGGVFSPPAGYMQAIRDLCDEHGILMITDEIICGFGRTGEMFGVDNWKVVPDMMTFAKGITSGYIPLGGVVMREKIRDAFKETEDVLFHGFTYSGHPTACAVALKNLEILERDNILANVRNMERIFKTELQKLQDKHPHVTNIRAVGLLGAFELYEDRDKEKPFASNVEAAMQLVDECFKRNLILRFINWNGSNIVAIAPPLIVNKQEMGEIFSIIDEALTSFENNLN
ncbi:aspartate aminotransferase family protein [Bacilli bacterium]|nr:aminotransferase [Bacilli bacterium VT-13-104]PZD84244.1 aspartate aminotransferase family protein [Bacilli bacterium]PZD85061.1 aspartate aminotransferase family protein [Bacilli bacterium]PZD88561.1 aspartate aminotransferase family protein [Bacilli bacterium]RCO05159.1 aspartate aminotransferase family protein [Bacilli bacterium]